MFFTHPDMSDGAVAATLNVSRQLVSRWHAPVRKAAATESSEKVADEQFDGGSTSTAQPAPPGTASRIDSQPGTLVLFTIAMPEHLEAALPDIVKRHPSLTIERVRDLAIARLNSNSRAGSWKSIGVSSEIGAEMVREDRFVRLVFEWAEGVNELRLAANATRIATSLSPNAVQALSFILERQHSEGWARENVLRIEDDLSIAVGLERARHILSDPRLIALENEMEMRRQMIEDEAIEGEFRELPSHDEVPPLRNVELDDSVPNQPRANRVPGQQGLQQGGFRPTQHRKVDGIETEFVDQRAPGGDDRPPF
jgi:hypothetical protein